MAKADTMILGNGEVYIEYHQTNLRIQRVTWNIPADTFIRAKVWWNGVLAVDRVQVGPSQGTVSVPGTRLMVMVDGQPDLPPELTYSFNVEHLGM